MIAHCYLYESGQVDPHVNLALEECLLEAVRPGQVILYLWQNDRTVVIGRNQNAYDECDIAALEADGGKLARRLSGGGAVYHDLGNLNFTFILPSDEWDLDAQTDVLVRALKPFGIVAERTGRNDLTVDGRKFSGHAYYHHGDKSYHHGTLMVCVDPENLARYLTASPLKLGAKGVSSVRSRVMNLIDAAPDIEIDDLKEELIGAFTSVFGLLVEPFPEERIASAGVPSASTGRSQTAPSPQPRSSPTASRRMPSQRSRMRWSAALQGGQRWRNASDRSARTPTWRATSPRSSCKEGSCHGIRRCDHRRGARGLHGRCRGCGPRTLDGTLRGRRAGRHLPQPRLHPHEGAAPRGGGRRDRRAGADREAGCHGDGAAHRRREAHEGAQGDRRERVRPDHGTGSDRPGRSPATARRSRHAISSSPRAPSQASRPFPERTFRASTRATTYSRATPPCPARSSSWAAA